MATEAYNLGWLIYLSVVTQLILVLKEIQLSSRRLITILTSARAAEGVFSERLLLRT
jgi:hypothetical protein